MSYRGTTLTCGCVLTLRICFLIEDTVLYQIEHACISLACRTMPEKYQQSTNIFFSQYIVFLSSLLDKEPLMMRDCLVHLFLYPLCMKPISWCKEMLNKGLEIHVKRIAYSFLVAIFKSLPCLT